MEKAIDQHIFHTTYNKNYDYQKTVIVIVDLWELTTENRSGEMSFLLINYYKERLSTRRHRSDHRRERKCRFSAGSNGNYSASY